MKNKKLIIILLFVFLILSVIISLLIGSVHISLSELFNLSSNETARKIITEIRLPRILNSLLVGSALSCSGIILQSLLRNNLAEPGLLGISAGAGLGAIIAFSISSTAYFLVTPLSFITAVLTSLFVFVIARNLSSKFNNYLSSNKIILGGIAINAFLSASNAFLLLYAGENISQIIFWLSGGLAGRGWNEFYSTVFFIIPGLIIALLLSKEYNVLQLGEELSHSMGVNIKKTQYISIAASSLLAASAVAVAGIISFAGLIIPNIARMITGSDYRYSVPASILLGGLFLVVSDTIARTILSPSEIPVGIITSFIGAPIFVWLIMKKENG